MTLGVLQVMSVIVALTLTLSMSPFVEAIAGGEAAKPGEFPHAVQLSSTLTEKYFCGGSIFSPNVVITAARCVWWQESLSSDMRDLLNEYTVVTAGTLENQDGKGFKDGDGIVQIRTVDRYVIHPGFNRSSLENDIALLIFEDPLNCTDNVKPIQLPPPNATYSRGTLAGWGITDGGNLMSPYLKKMELVFEDRETCNSDPLMLLGSKLRKVTDLALCAKLRKGNSPCKGDAGSSIICQGSNATLHNDGSSNSSLSPTICGIASFGKVGGHCGESDNIGVFVDVSKYLDWIRNEAEKHVEEVKTMRKRQKILWIIYWVILGIVYFILGVFWIYSIITCLYYDCKKMYKSRATPEKQV